MDSQYSAVNPLLHPSSFGGLARISPRHFFGGLFTAGSHYVLSTISQVCVCPSDPPPTVDSNRDRR